MNTRRDFLQTTALGLGAATLLPAALRSATTSTTTPPGSTPGVEPRHRNLFNGDSCVFFYNPEKWLPENFTLQSVASQSTPGGPTTLLPRGGPYTAKGIHRYVDLLADSGVDTFLVNANASRAWYPSKTIPTILDGYRRGDREYFRGHAICQGLTTRAEEDSFIDRIMPFMNMYQDLLDAGVDWLAEAAAACRRRKISPWVSIRMNDLHGHRNYAGSFFNVPLLKHPEMRLHHSTYSPTQREPGYRGGLNYERPEVRALMFEQIREVVEDYDYEGLELDWLRNPLCCEPNATPATVAMMSDWLREVRALTQRRATRTGRPYPLGLRIPGRLETLKSIGLDVAMLCREGTLDFISPSGFWCTTWEMPHDELRRQLGDRVTLYGVIEDGANFLPAFSPKHNLTQRIRYISSSREILRANAAGKLALGADGIEWFNFFCTDQVRLPGVISDYTSLREMPDLAGLRGQPKHYMLSNGGSLLDQPPFDLPPQLAVVLPPGTIHPFRLPMCAEPADRGLELVIQVVLKADETFAALPVAFNGCWPRTEHTPSDRLLFPCGSLTHLTPAHHGYNFRFPVSLLRDGWNEIVIENGSTSPLTLVAVELAVRPAPATSA
jgi:hypothetical protein